MKLVVSQNESNGNDKGVDDLINHLLDDIESGKVINVAVIYKKSDGGTYSIFANGNMPFAMLGAIEASNSYFVDEIKNKGKR